MFRICTVNYHKQKVWLNVNIKSKNLLGSVYFFWISSNVGSLHKLSTKSWLKWCILVSCIYIYALYWIYIFKGYLLYFKFNPLSSLEKVASFLNSIFSLLCHFSFQVICSFRRTILEGSKTGFRSTLKPMLHCYKNHTSVINTGQGFVHERTNVWKLKSQV